MPEACSIKELGGRRYRCYFELTLEVIGGKWKPIVLYHLALDGVVRFSELKRGVPGLTDRMLSRQLRELERDGLVHREVYRQVPPRVEYSLTPLGCSLIPVLLALRQWGVSYERAQGGEELFKDGPYEPETPPPLSAHCLAMLRRGSGTPDGEGRR
jgi:DNA-binding HxlR family transcriptional regulator